MCPSYDRLVQYPRVTVKDSGFETLWGRNFPYPSWRVPMPTQSLEKGYRCIVGGKAEGT